MYRVLKDIISELRYDDFSYIQSIDINNLDPINFSSDFLDNLGLSKDLREIRAMQRTLGLQNREQEEQKINESLDKLIKDVAQESLSKVLIFIRQTHSKY